MDCLPYDKKETHFLVQMYRQYESNAMAIRKELVRRGELHKLHKLDQSND